MASQNFSTSRLGYYQGNKYDEVKGVENARRTTAFANLYDKTSSLAAKTKTQMCRSVASGTPCRFGDRCSFAHSQSELKVRKCAFGTACRTRYSKTNPCRFDHSEDITPEAARNVTLAQEVKSFWDEEKLLEQAAAAWIESQPKTPSPKPFSLQIDVDAVVCNYSLSQSPPAEQFLESDDEMQLILALANQPIKIFQVAAEFNTMNGWERGMPILGSSIFTAAV